MFEKKELIVAVYYVYTADRITRKNLLEFLEQLGYKCEEDELTNRKIVLNSRFPVMVDEITKRYSILHNTVCAAAAASSQQLVSEEEFYALIKGADCLYDEYLSAVRRALNRLAYTDEEIAELFARPDIEQVLKDSYAAFRNGLECYTPGETAEILDLKIE